MKLCIPLLFKNRAALCPALYLAPCHQIYQKELKKGFIMPMSALFLCLISLILLDLFNIEAHHAALHREIKMSLYLHTFQNQAISLALSHINQRNVHIMLKPQVELIINSIPYMSQFPSDDSKGWNVFHSEYQIQSIQTKQSLKYEAFILCLQGTDSCKMINWHRKLEAL